MKSLALSSFCFLLICGNMFAQTNWKVGGNANAADTRIGLNTNFDMIFETNGVDRAVLENDGDLGIGTLFPTAQLHVNSGAGEDGFRVQVNGSTKLLVDDGGGVSVGSPSIAPANGLFVSGRAGIGTSAPAVKLHVTGGTDIELASGGFLVLGSTTGANVGFDDNEIMARSNGLASTLFLNNEGGDINMSNGGLIVTGSTNDVSFGADINVTGIVGFGSVEEIKDGGSFTIHVNSNIDHETDNLDGLGTSTNRWVDVWAVDGTINTSDAREKSNVINLNYGINDLMKLRPVSYTWTANPERGTKLGLIAQELQQVIPEVVRDWEYKANEATGKREVVPSVRLGVMYDDLIPVLVKSIQDQQEIISGQNEKIADLEKRLSALESSPAGSSTSKISGNNVESITAVKANKRESFLEQNIPNPSDGSTSIRFHAPAAAQTVIIQIFNLKGEVLKNIVATANEVVLQDNELPAGEYFYSLFVDGVKMDTKKMVIVR